VAICFACKQGSSCLCAPIAWHLSRRLICMATNLGTCEDMGQFFWIIHIPMPGASSPGKGGWECRPTLRLRAAVYREAPELCLGAGWFSCAPLLLFMLGRACILTSILPKCNALMSPEILKSWPCRNKQKVSISPLKTDPYRSDAIELFRYFHHLGASHKTAPLQGCETFGFS